MSVYRRHKRTDFSVIDNHVFKDKELTLKAKGLLTTILSLPEDWKYSIEGLASLCADGTTSVTSALNELIDRGYITRTQSVDESGRFNGYIYDIYEKPQEPCSENPITDNAFTDNSTVSNTNISNTKVLNTKELDISPIIPREKTELDSMFEQFWAAYPKCFRKANEKGCRAKFVKIKNLQVLFPQIMYSLDVQKRSKQWNEKDGEYIPAPLTWINQERWTITDTRTDKQALADEAAADFITNMFGGT